MEGTTTDQFAPEFGTRITHRRPEGDGDAAEGTRRRQPGARRQQPGARRRPDEGTGSRVSRRRRPGQRRRPAGGRRGTTPEPYTTTTPAPVEMTTVAPAVEPEEVFQQEQQEMQATGVSGESERDDMAQEVETEHGFSVDDGSVSETGPEMINAMEESHGVESQEMPAMMAEEMSDAPEQLDVMNTAEPQVTAEVMPAEEQMGPLATAPAMPELDMMQAEPMEQMSGVVAAPEVDISEQNGDGATFENIQEGQLAAELTGPISLAPILSEESQTTAEPIAEGGAVMQDPSVDISQSSDVSSGDEGQTQEEPELPEGIFQLQPAVTQTQESEEEHASMSENEEPEPALASNPSLLGESVDIRTTAQSESGAIQGDEAPINVIPEALADASEAGEAPLEVNALESFGSFPETSFEDAVDVGAVLREELGDESAEVVEVDEVGLPATGAGSAGSFIVDEPLQTLDADPSEQTTGFESFSAPSELGEDAFGPSIPSEEGLDFGITPENNEEAFEMAEFNPESTLTEEETPTSEGQNFGMSGFAPGHMTEGEMNGSPLAPDMLHAPQASDSGVMFSSPEAPGVIANMPETEGVVPDMPQEMTDDMPHMATPDMAMQDTDGDQFSMVKSLNMEMTHSDGEDDVMPTQPTASEMPDDQDQQFGMPSDAAPEGETMPDMTIPEDVASKAHDEMVASEDESLEDTSPFEQEALEDVSQLENEDIGLFFDPYLNMPSESQTVDVPSDDSDQFEPTMDAPEPTPEGFGPAHAESLLPEGEELAMEEAMMSEMDGITGDFQGIPEEHQTPEEGPSDTVEEAPMTMPEGNDAMFMPDFDVRSTFDDSLASAGEDDLNQTASDDTLPDDRQTMETFPEADFVPAMVAEPTIETLFPANGVYEVPEEGVISMQSDGLIDNMNEQEFDQDFNPSQEQQEMTETDPSAGSVVSDAAPAPDQQAVVDAGENGGQIPELDIRIVSEPVEEVEESGFPDMMSSVTEAETDAVDIIPEENAMSTEQHDAIEAENVEGFSEDQLQDQEGPESQSSVLVEGDQDQKIIQSEDENLEMEQPSSADPEGNADDLQSLDEQVIQEDQEGNVDNLQLLDQQVTEEDQHLREEPPTGYGPPHSDTIVSEDVTVDDAAVDDVTADSDVTAPEEVDDVTVQQSYEAASSDAPALQSA